MVSGRFGVGKGALAWFVASSLLLANACSGDSNVSFDPPPDPNGTAGRGGANHTQSGGAGASTAGDSNANSGSAQGGSAQGGDQNSAGIDAGGSENAGSANAGSGGMGGGTTAGSSAGGLVGMGGVAGTAGATAGNGGSTAGNGGATAGNGGATAGNGGATAGNGGATAGNGGTTAGNGGATAGNGGTTAGNGGSTAGSGGSTAGTGGMSGEGGMGGGEGGDGGGGGEGGHGEGDCTAASFGGHSYYFCGVVDSAPAAFTQCQALGMTMLSIESMAENTFVRSKQQGSSWLGGTDALEESEWRWTSTGSVFWDGGPKGTEIEGPVDGAYNDFLAGQPNDNGANETHENCLAISASGWNDVGCTISTLRAACESN